MTRINTNVSSLIAQKTLSRTNADLQVSLTRLSTGLRINAGKDDPAGLIASENLRRDITSIGKAITNSERANQLIATADSALGQVSSLLNDIRGLVTEAANTGALSEEQIAANQLQVDSSLEAIDRIAQVTTFQGRKILDGSLDFITNVTAGGSTISDLVIDQANLGASGSVAVDINVSAAAKQASLTSTVAAGAAGVAATGVSAVTAETVTAAGADTSAVDLTADEVVTAGVASDFAVSGITGTGGSGGTNNEVTIAFAAAGDNNSVTIEITSSDNGGAGIDASFDGSTLVIDLDTNGGATEVSYAALETAVENISGYVGTFTVNQTNGDDTDLAIADLATTTTNFANGVDEALGTDTIQVQAAASLGDTYNTSTVTFVLDSGTAAGSPTAAFNGSNIEVTVNDTNATSLADIKAAIEGLGSVGDFTVTIGGDGDGNFDPTATDDANFSGTLAGGITAQSGSDVLTITADDAGTDANGKTVTFVAANGHGATPTAAFDGSNNIVVTVDDTLTTSYSAIASAISLLDGYSATASQDGDNNSDGNFDLVGDIAQTITIGDGSNGGTVGTASSGGLADKVTFKLSGLGGAEVFTFDAGTSITQVVNAVNLVKDATGIEASASGTELTFLSSDYGKKAFADVEVISEGSSGTFESSLSATRSNGKDIVATVNGFAANGEGNTLSINSSTLDFSLTVSDGSDTDIDFSITGGGALFQLGPDVVSNQQARIGVGSLNTAKLGGVTGRLFELRSGGGKDLSTDPNDAAKIVDEVINKVTSLRGRLGAFQKTTIETNIFTLNDTLANLTEAESSIRDADFAAESARLTRAQILVQSGTSVLAIANQNPQNVLALLR